MINERNLNQDTEKTELTLPWQNSSRFVHMVQTAVLD